jgi:hypothetical protein
VEAFGRYLLTLPKFQNKVFISNPPGAALLIWTNKASLPSITGVSVVEKVGASAETGMTTAHLLEVLRRQLENKVPVLYIQYDDAMQFLFLEGERLSLEEAAKRISNTFNIKLGQNPAKAPNSSTQINDPFHLWSRDAFDGFSVMKTDIDILFIRSTTEPSLELISIVMEIKRSKKIPVGRWLPYVNPSGLNDINNYLLTISLCNLLKCTFITVHHDVMDNQAVLTGEEMIDYFLYNPGPNTQHPNQALLNEFASVAKRVTIPINQLLKI